MSTQLAQGVGQGAMQIPKSMSQLGSATGIPGTGGPLQGGPGFMSNLGSWAAKHPEFLMQQGQGAMQSKAKPPPPGNFPMAQPRPMTPLPGPVQRSREDQQIEMRKRLGGIGLY
jgi:hypothetical protein